MTDRLQELCVKAIANATINTSHSSDNFIISCLIPLQDSIRIYLCIFVVHFKGLDGPPAGLTAMINHYVQLSPCTEFSLPVWNGWEWRNDQEWPMDFLQEDLIQECDGLNGFSKTHFIRKNTVSSVRGKKKIKIKTDKHTHIYVHTHKHTMLWQM